MKKDEIREKKAETVCDEKAHAAVILAQEKGMDKKIVLPEDLIEFHDAVFDFDIITAEAMKKYPALRAMPPRPQAVLACTAAGMGQLFISKAFGISQQAIQKMQKKYDPDRMYALSPEAKKAFATRLVESKGLEALASITQEKLADSSAKDLTVIAKNLNDINQSMNASKHKKNVFNDLDSYLQEIPEADVACATEEETK